jgi:hypothetical protein
MTDLDDLLDQAEWPTVDPARTERTWAFVTPHRRSTWPRRAAVAAAAVLAVGTLTLLPDSPDAPTAVAIQDEPEKADIAPPPLDNGGEHVRSRSPAGRPATLAEQWAVLARPQTAPPPVDHAARAAELVALPDEALLIQRAAVAATPELWPALARQLDAPQIAHRRAAAVLLSGTNDPALYRHLATVGSTNRHALLALLWSDDPTAAALLATLENHPSTRATVRSLRLQTAALPSTSEPQTQKEAHHVEA